MSRSTGTPGTPVPRPTGGMRREVVISYDLADLPEGDYDLDSYQYDFERDLATGAEAGGWAKVPVKIEYRDVPS